MNKSKIILIAVMLINIFDGFAVTIETTVNLKVYFPEYSKIYLVCGQMPSTNQKNVEFCCEAAFTGELLKEFKHTNIADNHICSGVMKKRISLQGKYRWLRLGKRKMEVHEKSRLPYFC